MAHIKIEVSISDSEEKMSFKVKEGKQTFKWLAQVVQSRLTTPSSTRIITAEETNCKLVSAIQTTDNELINPRDCIADHADKDGLCKCVATVVTSFPSDVWGNPVYGDWTTAAYLRSELGMQWAADMTKWRERLEAGLIDSSGRLADTSALVVVTSQAEPKGAGGAHLSGDKGESKGYEAEAGLDDPPRRKSRPLVAPQGPILALNREAAGYDGAEGSERQNRERKGVDDDSEAGWGSKEGDGRDGASTRLRHK